MIDPSPDFRQQALRSGFDRLDAILVTHAHYDHTAGLDDIRPFHRTSGRISLYASGETINILKSRHPYFDNPTQLGGGVPRVNWVAVSGPFKVSDIPFVPLPALHGIEPVLGFRTGSFAYLTDVSEVPDSTRDLMNGLDCLVLGAIRYEPHPTHFNLEQALDFIAAVKPRRTFLTHITHKFGHAKVNRSLPRGVRLAYDGLRVTLRV